MEDRKLSIHSALVEGIAQPYLEVGLPFDEDTGRCRTFKITQSRVLYGVALLMTLYL